MNIPLIKKECDNNLQILNDKKACQPVALLMALVFYEKYPYLPFINNDYLLKRIEIKKELYNRCRTTNEDYYYAVPWGTLLGAVSFDGIYATLLSKKPDSLLNEEQFNQQDVRNLIDEAKNHSSIQLLRWHCSDDNKIKFLKDILNKKIGVLIPTLKWGKDPHSVVLTDFYNGSFIFNNSNPNTKEYNFDSEQNLEEEEFKRRWIHEETDDDLLIISDEKIDFSEFEII